MPAGTYLLVLPWDLEAIGGVSQVVASLYDGIRAEGSLTPRVLVLTWDARAPIEETDSSGRLIVRFRIRSPVGVGPATVAGLLRYVLQAPLELRRLRRFLDRYDVRVVNTHYIGTSDVGWAIAKALGLFRGKLILSLHGRDIRTIAELRGIARRIWVWALGRADAVVACSEGLAAETGRAFGLAPGKVVTIHNGVHAERLAARVALAIPPVSDATGPSVLNLGTFEHKKGHDVLLHAFVRVAARHPTARLTIMGRTGETRDATFALAAALGLGERVALRVDVPHGLALAALRAADVFVLSSRNEAFSVALLEAGALGKAVVATDVCGVAELIRDGDTGILVANEDVEALADGLLRMLNDAQLRDACGQRLLRRVREQFTQEVTCRGYLRLAGVVPP